MERSGNTTTGIGVGISSVMPHIYLAPWEWNDSEGWEGPFWDAPSAQSCVQRIDLRPRSAQAEFGGVPQGVGLFIYDRQVSVSGAAYFGDDLRRTLTRPEKDSWKGLLNISELLEGVTLEDVVWNTLTIHADPSGRDRVRPLIPRANGELKLGFPALGMVRRKTPRPGNGEWSSVIGVLQADYRRRRQEFLNAYPVGNPRRGHYKKLLGTWRLKYQVMDYRVFIPPDLPDEGFLEPDTTITESFNQADSDTLGPDLTWVEIDGDIDVVSNAAELQSGNNAFARADTDLSSDDHYAQAVGVNASSMDGSVAVGCRASTSATTYYRLQENAADKLRLHKFESGTRTLIDATSITRADNDVIRLECNGSDLTGKLNGTTELTATDTSITGKLQGGVGGSINVSTKPRLDDFEAADLAAGTPSLIHNIPARIYQHMLNR